MHVAQDQDLNGLGTELRERRTKAAMVIPFENRGDGWRRFQPVDFVREVKRRRDRSTSSDMLTAARYR